MVPSRWVSSAEVWKSDMFCDGFDRSGFSMEEGGKGLGDLVVGLLFGCLG